MTCYCDHDKGSHERGRGKCNKPGCDCETFDKKPNENDEPETWLEEPAWK